MLRRILPIAFVMALSACNMATSEHAMFSSEQRSTLKLKDGLWVADDPKCRFDASRPIRRWPKCAQWLVFTDGKITEAQGAKPGEMPVELVIADGKPPIFEVPLKELNQPVPKLYAYLAVEPTRFDSKRAVVDLRLWAVACGIYERTETIGGKIRHFPGMDDDCHPGSVEVLRAAAAAGPQEPDKKKSRMRWVRATAD